MQMIYERRGFVIAYGLTVFVWLQVEDNAVLPVMLFAWTGAVLLALRWGARKVGQGGVSRRVAGAGLLGALAGGGSALAAVFLMLIKTGLHSHDFPDYPPAQMIAVLERLPVWATVGALAGVGLLCARLAFEGLRIRQGDDAQNALHVEEGEA